VREGRRTEPDSAACEPVLLVAVSARMLAELARADGVRVIAADRFGDLDLRAQTPGLSLHHDLGGRGGMAALAAAAARLPAPALVYGAGLENRPDLVARLAAGRELLGTAPAALGRVRDPFALASALRTAGLAFPDTRPPGAAPAPRHGRRWLRKPAQGGGGRGVRPWRGGTVPAGHIVQERIEGVACSAAAVAHGGRSVLLGVSEQLIGRPALGARAYAWCGNVVPPRLGAGARVPLTAQAEAICARVAAAFDLRGVFGVDFVWDGERAWTVEVNPRPPASLEVLAAAGRTGIFAAHLAACAGTLPDRVPVPARAAGKAVVYARGDVSVGDTRPWPARGRRDVPHPGEAIAAGRPVCTLTATGVTPQDVLDRLEDGAARLRDEIGDREEAHALA
jgi:uncharacterized protein